MTAHKLSSVHSRTLMGKAILSLLALTIITVAQSIDRGNPTLLTSAEIKGTGGEQKTVHYYTFEGGPGTVSAKLEAKARKGAKNANVGIELFDAQAKTLTSTLLNEGLGGGKDKLDQLIGLGLGRVASGLGSHTGDASQKTSRVNLKEKQTLTLRVTVGPGIETYTVKLEGSVEFGQPANPANPTPTSTAATKPPPTEKQ